MSGILSAWKTEGIFSPDKIKGKTKSFANNSDSRSNRVEIERHFYDLRHNAEDKAEQALQAATSDDVYGEIYRELNELSIELAFAEIRDAKRAEVISKRITELTEQGDKRLKELNINKEDFVPKYSCKLCNDTGYDKDGNPCECLKKYLSELN